MKKRNLSAYIYSEEDIDELIVLVRDSFIPAFRILANTLEQKLQEVGDGSWEA